MPVALRMLYSSSSSRLSSGISESIADVTHLEYHLLHASYTPLLHASAHLLHASFSESIEDVVHLEYRLVHAS